MDSEDKTFNLVLQGLADVRQDVKYLDDKLDKMQEVHIKNSIILKEHERRSTASEARIAVLEKHYTKLQGFYFYGSIVLAAVAGSAAFFRDVVEGWLQFIHK